MTHEMMQSQIKLLNNDGLKLAYETCCEEYRRRLCEQWELGLDYSWWVAGRIGEVLCLNDCEYSMSIDDVRYFVDHNTSYEDFSEYWEYILDCAYKEKPSPNVYSWFEKGYRPKDYERI